MRNYLITIYTLLAAYPTCFGAPKDYAREIQLYQFRPHGGDKQEIMEFCGGLIKDLKNPKPWIAKNATSKTKALQYVKKIGKFQDVNLVFANIEKFYTVANSKIDMNYRAIVKFAFRGSLKTGKLIEFHDFLCMAKLGKKSTDWKLWDVIWQDPGIDVSDASLAQLDPPKKGDEICVMKTEAGDIRMRLFPEAAPIAIRNFKALARQGFYDNRPFLRVYDNFMIQGGALDGTKEYEISSYGKFFEDEISRNLFNFRGALCMGNCGPNTNSNQFYIVQSPKIDQEHLDLSLLALNAKAKYKEVGGRPYLDGRYTVFGQVFEGIEVVDRIAKQKADETGKPENNPIKILSVKFIDF